MRVLLTVLGLLLLVQNASAQAEGTTDFTGEDSIYKSIQCDIGQFAAKTAKLGLDPKLQAHIKYYAETYKSTQAAFSVGIAAKIAQIVSGPVSASRTDTLTQKDTIEDNFNVNGGNIKACFANRPPVGVYDCLFPKVPFLKTGHAGCETDTIAEGKVDASGKIIIWYFNIGPGYDYDVKLTYRINVDAPPPASK